MSTRGKLFFAFLIALMLFTSVGTAIVALAAGPGEVNFDGWALCPRMTERNPTQARLLIYNTDTTPEEALNEPAGAVGMIKFDGNLFGGSFSLSGQADYTVAMISGNVRVANTVRLYTTTDVARPDDFCSGPSIGGVEAAPTKPTEPTQPSAPIAAASKKEPSAEPIVGATDVATTTIEVGLPTAIEITAAASEIRAGETTVLTAEVTDANGFKVTNPVTVTFATEEGTIGEVITSDGVASATYDSTVTGEQALGAYFDTAGGETQLATTVITVTAGAPMTATVMLGSLEAPRSMMVGVTATDEFGNEVLKFDGELTTNNGKLDVDSGTATDGVFVTMLRELQPGNVEVNAVITEPTTKAPTAKSAAETESVEVKIEGEVDTLYEAWTAAYGTAPTHDQWTAYAAAHNITITDAGVPIVHSGDVLTFEAPINP
jgi:hypothetical protein